MSIFSSRNVLENYRITVLCKRVFFLKSLPDANLSLWIYSKCQSNFAVNYYESHKVVHNKTEKDMKWWFNLPLLYRGVIDKCHQPYFMDDAQGHRDMKWKTLSCDLGLTPAQSVQPCTFAAFQSTYFGFICRLSKNWTSLWVWVTYSQRQPG